MAQNNYECMVIFDSNKLSRDPGGVSGRVTSAVEELGGEILVSRLWAEQKLEYPIKGHRKGTYWLTYFRLEGSRVVELERAYRLNEDILRNLVVKIDPRLIDTLVAHAKGEALPAESEGEHESPDSEVTDNTGDSGDSFDSESSDDRDSADLDQIPTA